MDVPTILKRIELRIIELGMTKTEFYEKSGISSATYSQWNTNTFQPSKRKLMAAASALKMTYEELVGEETTIEQKEIPPTEKVVAYKLCNIPALKRERGITYNCRIFRMTPLYTLGLATCSVSIRSSIIPHTCSWSFPSTSRRNSLSPYLPTSTDISAAGAAEYACS